MGTARHPGLRQPDRRADELSRLPLRAPLRKLHALVASYTPSVQEIMVMRWDLDYLYRAWHMQQAEDERYYNAASSDYSNQYSGSGAQLQGPLRISAANIPDNFDQMRLPTGKTIIDTAAEHASGNFPRLHVPRKRETAKAQENT